MNSFLSSNNINWSYEIQGSGPDMLFIHGWGVDHRIWRQQFKYFSQSHRIIAIDLPGHGQTEWKREVTLEQLAQDIVQLLRAEEIFNVDVVGSSLGGMVALKLVDVAPQIVRSLTMVGSLPKFSKGKDYPYGINIELMLRIYHKVHWKFPKVLKAFFRSMFTPIERETRRFKWLERFRQDETAPHQWAIKEYLTLLFNEDLRDVLKKTGVPVCFIYGTGDPICDPEAMDLMKIIIPSAEFIKFENFGHFPFLMAPDEFNEALSKYLSKLNAREIDRVKELKS